jgi:hypothetical protein
MDVEKLVFIDETCARPTWREAMAACSEGLPMRRFGTPRQLANNNPYPRPAPQSSDRFHGG